MRRLIDICDGRQPYGQRRSLLFQRRSAGTLQASQISAAQLACNRDEIATVCRFDPQFGHDTTLAERGRNESDRSHVHCAPGDELFLYVQ